MDDDLIPDLKYQSVKPCRQNEWSHIYKDSTIWSHLIIGTYTHPSSVKSWSVDQDTPYDWCFFDLENELRENYSKKVNCSKQNEIANML